MIDEHNEAAAQELLALAATDPAFGDNDFVLASRLLRGEKITTARDLVDAYAETPNPVWPGETTGVAALKAFDAIRAVLDLIAPEAGRAAQPMGPGGGRYFEDKDILAAIATAMEGS